MALSALFGVIYVSLCFINKKKEIKTLVQDLATFENYSPKSLIQKTDESLEFYTKLFIVYGIVGNACYGLLPVLNYDYCQNHKPSHMVKYGIPCGLVVRFLLPFKCDYFPLAELIALHECAICMLGTTVIMVITMLICGVLIHTTTQLKYFRKIIAGLTTQYDTETLEKKMKFCVKFHTAIIE